jgi:DNA-directed RNA polymerase specialized sigma24 family protein
VGVAVPAAGKPLDPVAAGYQYLCNYCRHAIHAAERRVGPLPDHDDIIQQTCLEWLQQAGPPEAAFPRLLERASSEMQLLRETVNRVIMRITYQHRKGGVNADLSDWPAPDGAVERAWTDFKSDCEEGVGHLTQQDWQILELRRQGHTYREIGAKIGIARQRVWEMCHDLVARLQDIYGKVGDWEKRT